MRNGKNGTRTFQSSKAHDAKRDGSSRHGTVHGEKRMTTRPLTAVPRQRARGPRPRLGQSAWGIGQQADTEAKGMEQRAASSVPGLRSSICSTQQLAPRQWAERRGQIAKSSSGEICFFSGLCELCVFAPDYLGQGRYRRLSTAFQKSPCVMPRPFFMRLSAAFSRATNRGV